MWENLEHSYIPGGHVKRCHHFGKWFSSSTPGYVPKGNENMFTHGYVCKCYSSIVYNSQKVERTQCLFNWSMDEQDVVHPNN